ncbi:MAG TPA: hypothetical protein VGI96_27195 [Streptosporangiaceae bacterium]
MMAPVASVAVAMRRRYRHWWWLPGWLFAALTVLPALLAIAWLVPAFAMLAADRLTPEPMVIIFVPLAAALCYFTMRRMPVSWPRFRPSSADADYVPSVPASWRPDVPADAVIATVVIALAFAVWEALRHSQQVLAASDPGVYLQYGYWIAKHGSAKIPLAATAFGSQGPLDFNTYGFIPNGSWLTPDFMPGLPIVLAAGVWLHGISGALLAGPVIAGCAVLSFAGLCGRLVGPRWAPVGALVLALTVPEEYVGRTTLSEPLLQVLLFGGLCLIIDSLVVSRRRHASDARPAELAVPSALVLAGVGGFAFGLTLLVWIGALSLLLPVFPVLALMFIARRPQAGPLAMGAFLGAACGLFAALMLARPYLSAQSSSLHVFGLCAAGFGVATALVAPLGFPPVRAWVRRVLTVRPRFLGFRWRRRWRGLGWRLPSLAVTAQWALFAIPIIALIGFAVRPYVQVTKGFTDPYVVRYVASLQQLTHLPVDGRQQYYETSLDWVVWYLGVPAVLLACAGAALLGRRMLRAVHAWRTSATAARLWGLTYLVVAWSAATVLWDPLVLPGQPSASRRLVPVVLPGLVLLALWSACLLKGRAHDFGARRVTAWAVGVFCALALVIPAFWSAFAPSVTIGHRASSGVSTSLTWRGVATTKTGLGTVAAVDSLCSSIGSDASVVFTDALTADYFAPVVRGMCGQPATLVLTSGSGAGPGGASLGTGGSSVGSSGVGSSGVGSSGLGASDSGSSGSAVVSQVVSSIERAGRRPVLLGASQSSVEGFGVPARLAVSLQTRTDPSVLNGPPAGSWPFSYTVWLAAPPAAGDAGSSLTPGVPSSPVTPNVPSSSVTPGVPSQPAPGSTAGA